MGDVYSIFGNKPTVRVCGYQKYTRRLGRFPRFNRLIKTIGPLRYNVPIWTSLDDAVLYAVIGQMLSSAAAASIIKGLLQRFRKSSEVLYWASTEKRIGAIYGVSGRKRRSLREWQRLMSDRGNNLPGQLKKLSLENYRNLIDGIWGFGRWSADMIGIFYLGRMDIWPETDSGIKRTSQMVFGTNKHQQIKRHVSGCETVAALYLWEAINRKLAVD